MGNWSRWTKEMDDFLRQEYEWIGDTYLAEMFAEKFPKPFPWTKKHIEKRRWRLKLKRTPEQEHVLRSIHSLSGDYTRKGWDKRNRMKDGEVRQWNGRKYIKVGEEVLSYHRHIAGAKKGEIVRTYEGGIRIISMRENQAINARMRAERPTEFKETIKALNLLKKLIDGKENTRSQRNAF